MSIRRALAVVAVAVVASALAGCPHPQRDVAAADVPKLTSLEEVMDVQSTIAEPQMKKSGAATYTDADYAAFAEVSSRILATSIKTKEFSKGPEFDKLADQLHETAVALGKGAASKDAKASSDALAAMSATCKTCHSKFD